jgi:hypothetical protein
MNPNMNLTPQLQQQVYLQQQQQLLLQRQRQLNQAPQQQQQQFAPRFAPFVHNPPLLLVLVSLLHYAVPLLLKAETLRTLATLAVGSYAHAAAVWEVCANEYYFFTAAAVPPLVSTSLGAGVGLGVGACMVGNVGVGVAVDGSVGMGVGGREAISGFGTTKAEVDATLNALVSNDGAVVGGYYGNNYGGVSVNGKVDRAFNPVATTLFFCTLRSDHEVLEKKTGACVAVSFFVFSFFFFF